MLLLHFRALFSFGCYCITMPAMPSTGYNCSLCLIPSLIVVNYGLPSKKAVGRENHVPLNSLSTPDLEQYLPCGLCFADPIGFPVVTVHDPMGNAQNIFLKLDKDADFF